MRQIEQLAQAIGKMMGDFLKLKDKGQTDQGMEIMHESLKKELDIDMEKLLSLEKVELAPYLQDRKMTASHIEQITEYLTVAGKELMLSKPSRARKLLERAITLNELSDELSKTFSMERMGKNEEIKKLLEIESPTSSTHTRDAED